MALAMNAMNEKLLALVGFIAFIAVYRRQGQAPLPVSQEGGVPEVHSIIADLGLTDISRGFLLAFSTQIHREGGLYVELALLATQSEPNWALWYVYRHPRQGREKWTLSAVHGAPQSPHRTFDQRPGPAQVKKFIRDSWWKFGPIRPDFRLLRGDIYE